MEKDKEFLAHAEDIIRKEGDIEGGDTYQS